MVFEARKAVMIERCCSQGLEYFGGSKRSERRIADQFDEATLAKALLIFLNSLGVSLTFFLVCLPR